MNTDVSNVSDSTVLTIQEVFNLIQNYKYAEAFLLSSQIMKRSDSGDQLFHEWVKSLAEFFSCNRKKTAIQLLEKIKPNKPTNEIHFRIFNSLMSFYIEIEDEINFRKCKKLILSNLYRLNNSELIATILGNVANGYYVFKNHVKSLEFCEKTLKIACEQRLFNKVYTVTIMIKIMNFLHLEMRDKAYELKKDFYVFLEFTNKAKDKKYLDKAIDKFNEEVEYNEKTNKKTL
ncbi:hypothetical protein PV797_16355 [Clostridiaceae bacterium M8S5]|nr:hypothetical protein PV797_16355 [Clostridiaceae bacterium M8S5]